MALRITGKDKKNINNIRRKVKNLLSKTEMAGVDITDRIDIKYAKDFTTRKELNDYIALANNLTNRNNREFQYKKATDGSYVSVKDINEVNLLTRIANRNRVKRKKEQGKREQELRGEKIILSAYEIGNTMDNVNLLPGIPKNEIPTKKRLKSLLDSRRKQSSSRYIDERGEKAREKWLELVRDIIEDSADVVREFSDMPIADFWYLYSRNDRMTNVFYGSKQKKLNDYKTSYSETKLEELESILIGYNEDKEKANNR